MSSLPSHLEKQKQRFGTLVDEYGAALKAMLRRMARNDHDADEVFQNVAVRVWKNIDKCPQLRNPRAWLMTIGYRAFLDYRSKRREVTALGDDHPDHRQRAPQAAAEDSESAERVAEMVKSLPDHLRDVISLHYTGGLTLRETARALEIPAGTVKSRLHQALGLLRKSCHEL